MSMTTQTLRIYWHQTKKYKKQLFFIYPSMFVAQLLEDFVVALLISGILDNLASGNIEALRSGNIWYIFAAIVFLELFSHTLWNLIIRVYWRTQDAIMRDLQLLCFNHLQKMSFRFFSDRFAGSLVNQVNKFCSSYERLTDPLTWNVFKLLVSLLLTTAILLPRAPIVSAAILIIAAIYAPIIWVVRRKQLPYTTKWAEAETKRTGQLADTVSNILAVKSFSNEQLETERMSERVYEVSNRSIDTMKLNMKQEFGTGALQRSINLIVIIFSIMLALNGNIEVGTVYLSLTFTLAIMRRLWDLNNTFRNFTRVFGDAYDMTEILQITPEVSDVENPLDFNPAKGKVEFIDVKFKFADKRSESALFENLNLEIKPGEKIGLVGPSGGGKTTITKLVQRFMDIQSGQILIDGVDISKVTQHDLRKSISYVPQEPLLFHRTLEENIKYGNLDAKLKDVMEASKKAHAHEFIKELSEGYRTMVGERGVKLSGGQKQRVAIARAMLKKAPIIILDEATSALDSESEQLIQDALWKLMQNKTAIVIAHRLSTIQKMDRIIVLNEGKIVEIGSHEQLLRNKKGLYTKLWNHQSGGFLND